MNKQSQRPLGIFLEGPGKPSRSATRWGLWLMLFLVLLAAVGLFFAHPVRRLQGLFHQQVRPAEASRTPIRPADAQPLSGDLNRASALPPASSQKPPAPLPSEVSLLQAVSLTVTRNGRVAGVVHLQPGQRVKPISVGGGMIHVVYGDASGPVPVAATDYDRLTGGGERTP